MLIASAGGGGGGYDSCDSNCTARIEDAGNCPTGTACDYTSHLTDDGGNGSSSAGGTAGVSTLGSTQQTAGSGPVGAPGSATGSGGIGGSNTGTDGSGSGGGGGGGYHGGGGAGGVQNQNNLGTVYAYGGGGGAGGDYFSSAVTGSGASEGLTGDGEITLNYLLTTGVSIADGDPVVRPDVGKSAEIDFPVTLSSASSSTITVHASTSDGTGDDGAISGRDYVQTDKTVTFPAGATSENLAVPLIGTVPVGQTETFSVNLSNPSSGTSIGSATATGTILCSGSPSSEASQSVAAPQDLTSPCQLTVSAAVGEPDQLPGFWYDGTFVGIFDKSGNPQYLTVAGQTSQFAAACQAMCTNVAVLATDWQGQPVPAGTKVIASTFPIAFQASDSTRSSPFSVQPSNSGNGYLCAIGGSCGPQVTGTTGSDGIAQFRYFLPGIAGFEPQGIFSSYPYPIESLHFVAQAAPSCGCWFGAKGAGKTPVTLVPHTWVDNTRTVTRGELAGARAIIEQNAKKKATILKRFNNIVKLLKAAKILTDKDIKDFEAIGDKYRIVENLEKLLHADHDSVMLGWFMNRFEIANDGLLSDNFDWRGWANELEPYVVDYVSDKLERPIKTLTGKLGKKLSKKVEDYIDKRIHELLTATVDKLVGKPFAKQALDVVKGLEDNETRGEAQVTIKLQDVSYCYQQCLALPFPSAYTWLYMLVSGVYPQDESGGNYLYQTPAGSQIIYNPQIWIPAQCRSPFACVQKTATQIESGS